MYIVKQNIKGTIYIYEVTAYWDKEKKQARQRRVCIGKEDPTTGELIPSKTYHTPKMCRDFGNYYFLKSISDQIGLTEILMQTFPDVWREILTCAFFEISERKPLYLCDPWCDSTKTIDDTSMSSQEISVLLKILGEQDKKRMDFFSAWANYRSEKEYIAFDITSISSYSELIKYVEYGYNRDGESLPQINLLMLFGESSLLPIFYNIGQGSIRDVKTLKNMITLATYLRIQNIHFVMDKGFYSDRNIKEMLKSKVKFAISVPFTTTLANNYVSKVRKNIVTASNSFQLNGDIIYGTKEKIKLHDTNLQVFVYYDERNYLDMKESLLKHIMRLELELSYLKSLPRGYCHSYLKYLTIRKSKKKLIIHRNEEAINEYLKNKGFVVIISNDLHDVQETLFLYRSKDTIERAFDNLKNELDLKRLRIHSELAMTGRLFLGFITLIIHSWINKKMKEANLYKQWTQEEVMYELKKLKTVDLTPKRTILTEISKRQKNLFKIFQIPEPTQS
jgi:transposase